MNRIWIPVALSLVLGCGLLSDLAGSRCNDDGFCGEGLVCLEGRCETGCGALTDCGGFCVDLQQDPLHCGECQTACSEGWSCTAGGCAPAIEPDAGNLADAGTEDGGSTEDAGFEDGGIEDPIDPIKAPLCELSGWCWERPATPANDLTALHRFGPDHVWAIGRMGFAMRWNGEYWTSHSLPLANHQLYAIHGAAPDDVWAVGEEGRMLHWSGVAWSEMERVTSNTLQGVWMISRDYGIAVGKGGVALEWTGEKWRAMAHSQPVLADYYAIWGDGDSKVYAAGTGGAVAIYTYSRVGEEFTGSWSSKKPDTSLSLVSVGGRQGQVYVGGAGSTLFVEKLQSWVPVSVPADVEGAATTITTIDVSEDGTLWYGTNLGQVVRAPNGTDAKTEKLPIQTAHNLASLRALDGDRVLVVGEAGLIGWRDPSESEGMEWTRTLTPKDDHPLTRVASALGTTWALAGDGMTLLKRAQTGEWIKGDHPGFPMAAIAADAHGEDLWIVGPSNVAVTDGAGGAFIELGLPQSLNLTAVSVPTAGIAVVVGESGGDGVVLRCDKQAEACIIVPNANDVVFKPLQAVWAPTASEVWAVGLAGETVRCDVSTCSPMSLLTNVPNAGNLNAVWGLSDNQGVASRNVWIGGAASSSRLIYWDGLKFTAVSGVPSEVRAIAGDPQDVWAVTTSGSWGRLEQNSFLLEPRAVYHYLLGVTATADEFWVVGERGTVLRKSRQP